MANIDATTPQLKAVKTLIDAMGSLELKNADPILSKHFVLKSFPKTAEQPDMTREVYLRDFGAKLKAFTKAEVNFIDVVEAPGKVAVHHSTTFQIAGGSELVQQGVTIITLVDEDGELKISEIKDFYDPDGRKVCQAEAMKFLAMKFQAQ